MSFQSVDVLSFVRQSGERTINCTRFLYIERTAAHRIIAGATCPYPSSMLHLNSPSSLFLHLSNYRVAGINICCYTEHIGGRGATIFNEPCVSDKTNLKWPARRVRGIAVPLVHMATPLEGITSCCNFHFRTCNSHSPFS